MDLNFRHTLEKCGDGIIVLDQGGLIMLANDDFLSMSGYSAADVLGRHYGVLLPAEGDYQDVQGRPVRIDAGYLSQQPELLLRPEEQGGIVRRAYFLHRDGRLMHVAAAASLLFDQQGLTAGSVSVMRSVGGAPDLRDEVSDSLRFLKNYFEHNADGIIVTDRWGLIVKANSAAASVLGIGRQSVIGKNLSDVVADMAIELPGEDEIRRLFVSINGQLTTDNYQASFRRADGELCRVEMNISTLTDAEGSPAGAIITMRDITGRLKWEEQLLRSKQLESLSALAEGIANDFNAVMTAILGEISVAQGFVSEQSPAYARLERAEHEALRARGLVEQLLIFSRGGKPDMQRAAIEEIVSSAAEQALKRSDIHYELACGSDLWAVTVDREQVQGVLKSLMLNAAHAMPEGGTIAISIDNMAIGNASPEALSEGRYVRITLKDQAIGILNEYIQDIFDPYFMRGRKRSGLVLATAYAVLKRHGGMISVESEFGAGTVFYIYLPALGP